MVTCRVLFQLLFYCAFLLDIRICVATNQNDGFENEVKRRQILIFKLFNHILQPTAYDDVETMATELVFDQNFDKFDKPEAAKELLHIWNSHLTLSRGDIFCIHCKSHTKQAITAFQTLYHAIDLDTFDRVASWMRQNLNEGIFTYAFSIALFHREDTRFSYYSPPPYEVNPHLFIRSDIITKAHLIKMTEGKLDEKTCENIGVSQRGNEVIIDETKDVNKFITNPYNKEQKLDYFTSDISLNTYYFNFHADYPFWMGDDIHGLFKDRRGELYYFIHQQLIARYNLERLSNDLCNVLTLSFELPLAEGHDPALRYSCGKEMVTRPNGYTIVNEENVGVMRILEDYEWRIRKSINDGFITTHNNIRLELRKSEDIEALGRMVYTNLDSADRDYFMYPEVIAKTLLAKDASVDDKYRKSPTVLDHYETVLRDPVFWKLQKRIIDNFNVFKERLPPYTREELSFPGVKITNVAVDKLITFFEEFEMDITNVVLLNDGEMKEKKENLNILVKKSRLSHKPFKVDFDIVSDKTVDSVIRLFLGPAEDCFGNPLNELWDKNRLNYFEIDTFVFNLKTGRNVITRFSKHMHNVIKDRIMTRELWNGSDSLSDQASNITASNLHTGFPFRLLLSKGKKGGMKMHVFAVITPLRRIKKLHSLSYLEDMRWRNLCRSSVCFDSLPLGFPLDRPVEDLVLMFPPTNMKLVSVIVFHKPVEDDVKSSMHNDDDDLKVRRKYNSH